ncbi:MAG TPA: zf-HC2 domain-containing protein [Thermoanaerobaculia bacterium]|nr:zf-HC2 domain-containing protein [Thermoanaerobaculia bacterium]
MTSARPFLPCSEVIAFLADYLANELAEEIRAEFQRHLVVCPSCIAYLRSYEQTIRMAKLAAIDTSEIDDAPEDLINAILEARMKE